MKAITSENKGLVAAAVTGVYGSSAKIVKHKRDVENEEIRAYLSKLKELVPFMPKNRRLSKLEVIQYAIDYICDLQHALETHPTISSAAVHSAAAAAVVLSSAAAASQAGRINLQILGDTTAQLQRQPLGILPPNANAKSLHSRTCSNSAATSASDSVTGSDSTMETSITSGRSNEVAAYSSDSSKHVAY